METLNKERKIALILAGGQGDRMHSETPKQFLPLCGEPVIIHTLRVFESHPEIDAIAIVCHPDWKNYLKGLLAQTGFQKIEWIVDGGENSHLSIRNGIAALLKQGAEEDIVLVHEAVRPLLSSRVITENIQACRMYGNAITAIQDNESLMYSEDGQSSSHCFLREQMYKAQTPHTFRLGDLRTAYQEADGKSLYAQSLYTLMATLGRFPFHIVAGERRNLKITYPEDIAIAELLLSFSE